MANSGAAVQDKTLRERIWNIVEKLLAAFLFAIISGGTAYLYGLGSDHRDLSARVDAEIARIDREIGPVNGVQRRDAVIKIFNELDHWKSRGHRLEERVTTMDKGFHQEIESLARFSAEVKSKCDIIAERCEYYRRGAKN